MHDFPNCCVVFCQAYFLIGITLLKDVAVCQPFLTGPTAAICPRSNETITLTCRDRQVVSMSWDVQPHHTYPDFKEEMIVYIPNDNNLIGTENIYGNFTGVLINITNKTNGTADLTSTLAVLTTGIYNGTNITCRTKQSAGLFNHSSVILNIAGVPYSVNAKPKVAIGAIIFQEDYTIVIHYLATLFNDGGAPIDYYNISFNNSEDTSVILSTSEATSTVTLPHNVTTFNVTAYNCIGPSDPVTVYTYQVINSSRHDQDGTAIEEVAITAVVGTIVILFITSMTVVLIYICVKRMRNKPGNGTSYENGNRNNFRFIHGDNEGTDTQHGNDTSISVYSYVQAPLVEMRNSSQYSDADYYAAVDHGSQPKGMLGEYAEIGSIHGPLSSVLPPPVSEDTVQYSIPDLARINGASLLPPQLPSSEESVSGLEAAELVDDSNVHPLDKIINGHNILLQLGLVKPYWRTFGSAAGLGEGLLDMIDADLMDDSERLAEVVFRWLEQKASVTWSDIAHLCKQTGFHELSEAIAKAYENGVLPVQDDPKVPCLATERAVAPPLPPRSALERDAGGSPPPPLPPPLSSDALHEIIIPSPNISHQASQAI